MRVTYGRELKLKEYLDSIGVNSYVPMHYINNLKSENKRKLVPIIRNLIFVQSTRSTLDEIKANNTIPPTRYVIDRAKQEPMVVPNQAMNDFIKVTNASDDNIIYLTDIDPMLGKGDKVRVTDGIFKGVEGEILRLKRDRRVVVSIKGIIAVATTYIHQSKLEKIQ